MAKTAVLGTVLLAVAAAIYMLAGPGATGADSPRVQLGAFDVGAGMVVCLDLYLLLLAFWGRQRSRRQVRLSRGNPFFVLAIPARHGAGAVASSVAHLLGLQSTRYLIVVIDCGHGTISRAASEVARGDRRVILERLPGASRADALNRAVTLASELVDQRDHRLEGVSAAGTVLGVLEPGAWLDPLALTAVAGQFDRQHCAAIQTHVAILGARGCTAAALEDFEAAAFGTISQTPRNRSGTAQLGPTGAFLRLGALRKVSLSPWRASLDDELDIGLRLIEMGYRVRYCPDATAYRPATGSIAELAHARRRRARARRQAVRQVPRLWETRRISVATRLALTFDLALATPLLVPAVTLACLLAAGLGLLADEPSRLGALLPTGVGLRALVVVSALLPLLAGGFAYLASGAARKSDSHREPGLTPAPGWALPGLAVAYLLAGLARIVAPLSPHRSAPPTPLFSYERDAAREEWRPHHAAYRASARP